MVTINVITMMLLVTIHFDTGKAYVHHHMSFQRQRWLWLSIQNESEGLDEEPPLQTTKVTLNDGGSDLSERFKYKVNALMGTYDPKVGTDDEYQFGNIISALLNFPTKFTFNVVGRTNGNDVDSVEYEKVIKQIVASISGDLEMECSVKPRGKSFTRVSITVSVESAGMIKANYSALDDMETTVMMY